ncbi:saccharopine dehydrogenase family protein [Streptomyces sp. 1222.5]|uniref:saccharopine dehydrogenase family protein n=1 Tax=Streptomyces sp. 1222.5 TaxID=1881026 RepID=UPI003EB9516E
MRILLVGAGRIGAAIVSRAARRTFFDCFIVAERDLYQANAALAPLKGDGRFLAAQVDVSNTSKVAGLLKKYRCNFLVNATHPRFCISLMDAALAADANYVDVTGSLSQRHPERPYELTHVKLADAQFDRAEMWERSGGLALVGMGAEPGLSGVFSRYAEKYLFDEIEEIGVRATVEISSIAHPSSRSLNALTAIHAFLKPPVVFDEQVGWYTTEPFSGGEIFHFPAGVGPLGCINVEHEDVLMIPRWIKAKRVTFKYGLDSDMMEILHNFDFSQKMHAMEIGDVFASQDIFEPSPDGSPSTAVTSEEPSPSFACTGVVVTGVKDGQERKVYLYHAAPQKRSTKGEFQGRILQTSMNSVAALELLAKGLWTGCGVLGSAAMSPEPFLRMLKEYGTPCAMQERSM